MSALSPPFGGGETTGLTLEDFSNIPEPLPSARGLPTHTRTLSLTTKIEERETRETTLRTSLPAPLASPPPPPRPFRPPRSSTKSSPNSPFYFTPSPSSPLLTGPSPSLPTKSTPSATTSEVLLRGGQTLESILNAPGPGGPGSIYAASPRITKRMTVQLASNYAEMNKSCLKKEASQVSPYQFNSIRLKKQTPKSMVDGTLFLAPLAKASRIVTNLDDGWEIETGSSDLFDNRVSLIDLDRYTPYYRHYFFEKEHEIYIGSSLLGEKDKREFFILCLEKLPKIEGAPMRVLVLSSKKHTPTESPILWGVFQPSKKPLLKQLMLSPVGGVLAGSKLLRIDDSQIRGEIVQIEDNMIQHSYKFGVLLCMEGQTTEEEMLQNEIEPPEFVEFLSYLGKTIQLQGFDGFNGGLDVKHGDTGNTSVYTKYQSIQVMYHVSTMLPFDEKDHQQIARKKFIGNDVVVFIFMMGNTPFDPCSFVSEFNHVFIAVKKEDTPDSDQHGYQINVVSRGGIHSISPPIPDPPILPATPKLHEFLTVKAINSERAAMYAPRFSKRLDVVRNQVISNLVESNLGKANKKKSLVFGLPGRFSKILDGGGFTHRPQTSSEQLDPSNLKKSNSFQLSFSSTSRRERGGERGDELNIDQTKEEGEEEITPESDLE